MNKITGIYKITSPTNKVYIGQSWNIKARWHKYNSNGAKYQPALLRSFQKHGVKTHNFEIIHELQEYEISQESLNKYECIYIELYKAWGYELLNVKGGGSKGKLPQATIELIRQKATGRKNPNSTKKVLQFDIEGNFIKEWYSLLEASDALNIHCSNISACCKRRVCQQAGGYIWRYKNDGLSNIVYDPQKSRRKPILQINKATNSIVKEWASIKQAMEGTGITGISSCLRGHTKKSGGYRWAYKNIKLD